MGQCFSSLGRKEATQRPRENTEITHTEFRQDQLKELGNPPDLVPEQEVYLKTRTTPKSSSVIESEVLAEPFVEINRQEISNHPQTTVSQEVNMAARKRSSSESHLTESQMMTTADYQTAEDKFKMMTASIESKISNVDKQGKDAETSSNLSSGESARAFKNLMPRNPEIDDASHTAIIGSDLFVNLERLDCEKRRDTYNTLCGDWKEEIEGTLAEADADKLLCGLFVVTYEREEVLYKKAIGNIASVLLNPFKSEFKAFPKNYDEEFRKLPNLLQHQILDWIQRKMDDPAIWGDNNELIDTLAEQKYIEAEEKNDLKSNAIFKSFMERVAKLCRNMLTQNPQWHFKREMLMKKWKEEFRSFVTPMEGSNENGKDACIKYYRKPVLYAGTEVIEKGIAYVDVWKRSTRKK